jgi:hypothetical protein
MDQRCQLLLEAVLLLSPVHSPLVSCSHIAAIIFARDNSFGLADVSQGD